VAQRERRESLARRESLEMMDLLVPQVQMELLVLQDLLVLKVL
jgi:hypothetical protein